MTRFRIVEEQRLDGKRYWYVEQYRGFFPLAWWSRTYFFSFGSADYGSMFYSFEEAEKALGVRRADTLVKVANRPWNKVKRVVVETEV